MDPQAVNYNASATINDGSCIYNATNYAMNVKDSLPNTLSEISGMIYWNGKLYVHNDGGNATILFEIDTLNGAITKEIFLEGTSNIDWEDITQDQTHIYLGDVGNNAGDRTNLKIYKFPKAAIGPSFKDTISQNDLEIIQFTYPDQINFAYNLNNTAFDCEAIAYRNNKIHLFTKNWTLGACVHYAIPNIAGTYIAERIDSINSTGTLITAADFASNNQLMLLGYKNSGTAECALWFVYDFDQTDSIFFKGNKRKINIGDAIVLGQLEGVCFVDSSGGFASNEHFNPIAPVNVVQKLYGFQTTNWFPYSLNTEIPSILSDSLNFYVKVQDNAIHIYFTLFEKEHMYVTLYSHKGRKIREKNYQLLPGKQHLSLENVEISDGIYYVLVQNGQGLKKVSKIFFENR